MTELQKAEHELYELTKKLAALRKASEPKAVKDYIFQTESGEIKLSELFGDKEKLLLIHNMGQGCRYCTLWADGFNGFVPHVESEFALALTSKDDPITQRAMANSRGWRFRTVSHGGGEYIQEQSVQPGEKNYPGIVAYIKKDGKIYRKNAATFGPGDEFCSMWNLLSLLGEGEESWTPQFQYWRRPQKMDDGGQNLND
ncbi:MAG: DUF899 family protein [Bdellovibrionales bacterium]|nr:DUF899 family protein [Bdellovibrionales bacterium]